MLHNATTLIPPELYPTITSLIPIGDPWIGSCSSPSIKYLYLTIVLQMRLGPQVWLRKSLLDFLRQSSSGFTY
jgi:hypothetical protein